MSVGKSLDLSHLSERIKQTDKRELLKNNKNKILPAQIRKTLHHYFDVGVPVSY